VNLYPKASIQHRLASYFLDLGLAILTLGVGWVVWSLIVWRSGQTPAKQILKLRVVAEIERTNATWKHMAIRQLLIPVTLSFPGWLLMTVAGQEAAITTGFSSDPLSGRGVESLGNLISFIITATDAFWIFRGNERKRVTDHWAKTIVVNEANPISA